MSRPPKATLVLASLKDLGQNAIVGIDTQFFTVNNLLMGIKLIPAGLHLFHFSNSVDDGTSVRYGWWFECKEGDVITVLWNEDSCVFVPQTSVPEELGDIYQQMVQYPEDAVTWSRLSNFIDSEVIEEYIPEPCLPVTTSTPLREENMVLSDILMSKNPEQKIKPDAEELRYTIIQHKGPSPKATISEVTENALDRSWYLKKLFGHDLEILLAEWQLCFVHFVVLGNLCSCTQWLSILKLILMSSSFLKANHSFADSFMNLFEAQLRKIPHEYIASSLDQAVVDFEIYFEAMENLYHIFGNSKQWTALIQANKQFGINLAFTSNFDEENFEVYDMNNYDEDDENAPAIVPF